MPFWLSISILSVVQGLIVALPGPWPWAGEHLARVRSGWWALLPLGSLLAVAYGLDQISGAPQGLTYLALIAVPVLAALALGWAMHGARPVLAAFVVPLFGIAWVDPSGLSGQGAATVLTALSCVALGVIIVGLAPSQLVLAGVVAMAVADVVLVINDQLQHPSLVLATVHPVAQLPRLQSILFGSGVMGYGDFFVAGLAGALLASRPPLQRSATVLAVALALAFDLMFLRVSELPATVPIAVALVVTEGWARLRRRRADEGAGVQRA